MSDDEAGRSERTIGDDAGGFDAAQWAAEGSSGALEDMRRTLATFGTRLDSLVTSTTSYRSAITDRLVEYADMVNTLVRNQSEDLAAHQQSTDRLLQELRRGLGETGETVSGAVGRLEGLLADDPRDEVREVLTEVRGLVDSHDRLGRFIVDALDQFGDRVSERLDGVQRSHSQELADLRSLLDTVSTDEGPTADTLRGLEDDLATVRAGMPDLASGEVVGALWDEVRGVRDDLAVERSDVARVAAELATLQADLAAGLEIDAPAELHDLVDAVRDVVNGRVTLPLPDGIDGRLSEIQARLDEPFEMVPAESLQGALDDLVARLDDLESLRSAAGSARASDDALRSEVADLAAEVRSLLAQAEVVGAEDELDEDGWVVDEAADDDDREVWSARSFAADADLGTLRSELAGIAERLDAGLVVDIGHEADEEILTAIAGVTRDLRAELDSLRDAVAERPAIPEDSAGDEPLELELDLTPVIDIIEDLRVDLERTVQSASADTGGGDGAATADSSIDAAMEGVRQELVALRRRIKLKAEGEYLDAAQIEAIADAVARRLS